jgi:hypothetical protein
MLFLFLANKLSFCYSRDIVVAYVFYVIDEGNSY